MVFFASLHSDIALWHQLNIYKGKRCRRKLNYENKETIIVIQCIYNMLKKNYNHNLGTFSDVERYYI